MKLWQFRFFLNTYNYLAIVLVMPIIVFLQPLLQGEVLFWGLPATQFIPWRVLALEEWSHGLAPLWNTYNGLGAPLLANYQLAFFYPPGWILNLFWAIGGVQRMAWGYLLVNALHLSWAGLGMSLFVKDLGVGRLGQVISGLAFGSCAYFTARIGTASMIWAGAWLPWMMLGANQIVRWAEQRKGQIPFLPILAISFQLLAGHAQLTWYSLLLFGLWLLFSLTRKKNSQIALWGCLVALLVVILSIGLASIQLIPTMEFLLNSQRSSAIDFETGLTYSFWPWRLLTFLNPDFFGNPADGTYFGYASFWEDAVYLGFIPFILGLGTISVLFSRKEQFSQQKPIVFFFWLVNLVGFILALGKNTPIFPFLYRFIPTFDMFNGPTRFMIWVEFGLSVLGGMAVSGWRRPDGVGLKRLRLLTAGAGAIAAGAGLAWLVMGDIQVTFISSTAIIGVLGLIFCGLTLLHPQNTSQNRTWQILVVGVVCADLFLNTYGNTPTTKPSFYSEPISAPEGLANRRLYMSKQDEYLLKFSRFFRFGDFQPIEDWVNIRRVFLPNTNILEKISMVNNFDPMISKRFAEVTDWLETINDDERQRFLEWMNIGVRVNRDVNEPPGIAFEPIQAWGRYRWVGCAIAAASPQEAWQLTQRLIIDAAAGGPSSTILETKLPLNCSAQDNDTKVKINVKEELSQKIVLQVQADSEGYLVVANTLYPGWQATIDDQKTPLIAAEYLFYALPLPQGDHEIVLEFAPQSFYTGTILSGIFIIFVIISRIINRTHQLTKPK